MELVLSSLELFFPNGTRFVVRGSPRHQKTDAQRGLVKVGFVFAERSAEDDRRLWFMVREIEREAARMAGNTRTPLAPSQLFQGNKNEEHGSVSRRQTHDYATAMTRRLAPTAAYLDNQILALRQAARRISNYRLTDTTLFVTLEPCFMCAGAIIHARVKRVVFAAYDQRAGAVGSLANILQTPMLNHTCEVTAGVREEESVVLLQSYFQQRRTEGLL